MSRLSLTIAAVIAIASDGTVASVALAQGKERDPATQVKILNEEVRLLKLRIAELEKELSELLSTSGQGAEPRFQSEFPISAKTRLPSTELLSPWGWGADEPAFSGQIASPVYIGVIELPSTSDELPQIYDTGLYVFPGLDAPQRGSSKSK